MFSLVLGSRNRVFCIAFDSIPFEGKTVLDEYISPIWEVLYFYQEINKEEPFWLNKETSLLSVCENQYLRITRLIKVQICRTLWHPCSTHLRPFHHRPSLRELNNQQASFHHHPPDHLLLRLRMPHIQKSWLSLSWSSLFGFRPSHRLLTVQPPLYQPPTIPSTILSYSSSLFLFLFSLSSHSYCFFRFILFDQPSSNL